MALWNGVQEPKDLPVSRARTLVYKLMVIAPIALTLAIGVESRTASDPFEPLAYSADENRGIERHAKFVKQADELIRRGLNYADPSALADVAENWVAAIRAHEVKPLTASFYEDSGREGAKGRIMTTAARLIGGLNLHTRKGDLMVKEPSAALRYTTLALRLSSEFRDYDLSAQVQFAIHEQRSLKCLSVLAPRLTREQRDHAITVVAETMRDADSVQRMVRRERLYYTAHMFRRGEEVSQIEANTPFLPTEQLRASAEEPEMSRGTHMRLASIREEDRDLENAQRLALKGMEDCGEAARQALAALKR